MVNSGQGTVTQQFTKAIVAALKAAKLPVNAELERLLEEIKPHKRVPMPLQDALWEMLRTMFPEPDLGLRLGNQIQPGHLDVVGFLLLSCDTLEDALDVLLTYHPIVGEGGEFLSTDDESLCRLIYSPFHNVVREQRVEAVMATLVQLTDYLTGGAFQPDYIAFRHSAQMPLEKYKRWLGCEVRFDELADAMVFAKSNIDLPLVQANSDLFDQMRTLADDQLSQLQDSDLKLQVVRLIQQNPKWGKERVAESLGMSGRHLNRNLAREGVTFKILTDQTRLAMVKELLGKNTPKAEIATRMGFHDESALSKTFKRWTNLTLSEYSARQ